MPRISLGLVEHLAADIVRANGATPDIANDVAAHLVLAERSGHASHGLSILPSYLDAVRDGTLDPTGTPTLLSDSGMFLRFDGRRGYGQHAGKVAVAAAIDRATDIGACFVTLKNSYHLGRAGHYGEMAAAAGLVYLSFVNVVGRGPTVAPFGGAQARLSTNPVCFAAPIANGRPPFLLDYATSGIAANKVRLMAAEGRPVPPGLLIDGAGRPTEDPHTLAADPPGALLPFGEHKGYALGFMAELLAGVLSGGGTIAPKHLRDGGLRNNLLAIVFDPLKFGPGEWQQAESAAFADYVTACPTAPGASHVMTPGEPEAVLQHDNAESFEMTLAAWQLFASCAQGLGFAADACLRDG
jgi:L-lactate dehydrogenase